MHVDVEPQPSGGRLRLDAGPRRAAGVAQPLAAAPHDPPVARCRLHLSPSRRSGRPHSVTLCGTGTDRSLGSPQTLDSFHSVTRGSEHKPVDDDGPPLGYCVEAVQQGRSADLRQVRRISAQHQLVGGAAHPHVQTFSVEVLAAAAVDSQHHSTPLQPLEPQHAAVEDLLGVPVGRPVRVHARRQPACVLGVPRAGGEQRDVLGSPAVVQQHVDLVVGRTDGIRGRARHEPHRRAEPTARTHGAGGQSLQRLADLPAVAQVVLEGEHGHRLGQQAGALEDPLPLVAEQIETAGLRITQRGAHDGPPVRGEVLCLVHDDRVESLAERQCVGDVDHGGWQPAVPVVGVGGVVGRCRAPVLESETVKGAGIGRPGSARVLVDDLSEIGGQPSGVAQESDPLPCAGQSAGLLQGQPGLA